LNTDGVHKRGGEFIPKELQMAVDKDELTEKAVKEALELGHDRGCWLVCTSGIEHTVHVSNMLNDYGIPARPVHSGNKKYPMTAKERDLAIREFRSGKIRAAVNNIILSTGFDHKQIDMIVNLLPTSSPGRWVQILGRGIRPVYAPGYDLDTKEGRLEAIAASEKQDCLVGDFADNTRRLGPINDPVIPKKKGEKGGSAPVKLCEGINKNNKVCNTWIHASLRVCPECGHEFKFQSKLKQSASTRELIKKDLPIVEEFEVDHITYSQHIKQGRPPSMKVTYYCNLRRFTDYVCLEHEGFALRKARGWWRERTDIPVPQTTERALSLAEYLVTCTSIRVWTNKRYPEIMAHCFDGSHFGKREINRSAGPTVQTTVPVPQKNPKYHLQIE
jgi:DNA repair protein RadD